MLVVGVAGGGGSGLSRLVFVQVDGKGGEGVAPIGS